LIYATVDVELRDHERIFLATADVDPALAGMMRSAVLGLFTWSLLWCRAKRTDGRIPKSMAHAAFGGGQDEIIRRLLGCGLWKDEATHYELRNYGAKNDTREQIEARVAATAERKGRYREKQKTPGAPPSAPPPSSPPPTTTPGDVSGTRSARVPIGVGVGVGDHAGAGDLSDRKNEPERQAETTATPSASGALGFAAAGWIDGVRSVTNGRPTLAPWETRAIEDLALERPPDADPSAWAFAEGATFARRQRASKPPMRVDAKGYLAWVGDGRQGPLDRTVTTIARVADTPPAPYHKPFVKRAEAPAVPPPADFATALDALGET